MAQKWEDTKKASSKYKNITAKVEKQFGFAMGAGSSKPNARLVAAAKAAKNAKAERKVVKSPAEQAEAEYRRMLNAGKVGPKNVNSVKEKIANKWGVWPSGNVN